MFSESEISALDHSTKAGCLSTPALFAWKHETQDNNGWVPGGYIDYILMEKAPGIRPRYIFATMDRQERDQLRAAFKEAWLECIACGMDHQDCGVQNLVWDREKRKWCCMAFCVTWLADGEFLVHAVIS
ncbi:hypothetical protein T310_10201 [Rasamsonia emersonii CBS 393.64]|uniref:Uncharacterized protein n=1 Tax=Rasamsonia emersonii (strain ATCC 16479 / CBS 393.64 / IMI 116815) TaxID=1408163 RepID=A0A0F4YDN1_RASE3|nr:hypothetical protein T310_10201 [Rasamsonia emersonii CBS 393.64]KKA16215.1 hypothetical protein T310_10201 [Rasamsonia emersonii CBS 393.64]